MAIKEKLVVDGRDRKDPSYLSSLVWELAAGAPGWVFSGKICNSGGRKLVNSIPGHINWLQITHPSQCMEYKGTGKTFPWLPVLLNPSLIFVYWLESVLLISRVIATAWT